MNNLPVLPPLQQTNPSPAVVASALPALPMPSEDSRPLAILGEWVTALGHARTIVEYLADTAFLPACFWPNVGQGESKYPQTVEQREQGRPYAIAAGTAAVLRGFTLGLDPLTALGGIYVVRGNPGLYAKLKVAVAQSRGHEVWTEEWSDTRVVVCGRRRGSDRIETVSVTYDMAVKAKWTRNETYEKTPADMLWNRAAGRLSDRIAGDALFGLPTAEDIAQEGQPADDGSRRVAAPKRRAAAAVEPDAAAGRLRPDALRAPEAADVPPLRRDGQQQHSPDSGYQEARQGQVPPPTDTSNAPISDAEWAAINARFRELGIVGTGKAASRLAVISTIVERPITQGRQLTSREADTVLANLADPSGARLCAEVLAPAPEPEQTPEAPMPAPEQSSDHEDFDPTAEADWPAHGDDFDGMPQ